MHAIHRHFHVLATGQAHFRRAGRVGAAAAALEHVGGGQQLGTVAHRGDRLGGLGEGLPGLDEDEWVAEAYLETDYSKITREDFEKVVRDYALFNLLGATDLSMEETDDEEAE